MSEIELLAYLMEDAFSGAGSDPTAESQAKRPKLASDEPVLWE
ncbi:MAG: hypothetical protein ABWY52_02690 [Candidatus Limnocylindrales bacterium]